MKKLSKIDKVLSAVLYLIGICCFVYGFVHIYQEYRFFNQAKIVPGTIVELRLFAPSDSSITPVYVINELGSEKRFVNPYMRDRDLYQVNQEVPVRYDSESGRSEIKRQVSDVAITAFLFFVMGLVAIGVSILSKRALRVYREG